ncbi:MAG: InlB B-repeat-containing protein, partial [Erysipelotrichaceae bacterium]|nr:InlB B-repeat-containing protein [Erysipelotrichaceae bacterium]
MAEMFAGCSSLKELDLSGFDTSTTTSMAEMFAGCSSLEKLDLSSFNTSGIDCNQSRDMLDKCDSLQDIKVSKGLFKGDLSESYQHPIQGIRWMLLDDPSCFKLWQEMNQDGNDVEEGWWRLAYCRSCLSLVPNDGSEIVRLPALRGDSIDLSHYSPSREDYSFKGWYLDPDCTVKADVPFVLNTDTTLYGDWERIVRKLTFETNGGSEISPAIVHIGSTVDLNDYTPEKEGLTFTGWYFDPACKDKADDSIILSSNLTVYAGWQIQNNTLTLESNCRISFVPMTFQYGSTINLNDFTLESEDGIFTGWYTDPDCTSKAEDQFVIKANTVLYAGWKR